ncbi:MAG: T9SS C-terminal target domain-containing protein [Bacteroidota bacterium]|nr:T9SS C-terminal target domain-containing protein [Bacteroidota bacterium]
MFRAILILILVSSYSNLQSQVRGCTDPQALNYNTQATINDGKCKYKNTNFICDEVAKLPITVKEISGIISLNGYLWGHNDGNNSSSLYKIDAQTGAVLHEVKVNTKNKDWEDITQDGEHIYIGDFGNNNGSRKKLKIYIIDKSKLDDTAADAKEISFKYPDQTDFTKRNRHNFDCEAFFYWQDTLHLFTKNWLNKWTKHYTLPAKEGEYTAHLVDSFNTNLLITGADVSPNGKWAALCGYDKLGNIGLWILFGYDNFQFTKGNKRFISLGSALTLGQMEGLAIIDTLSLYLGSENFKGIAPQQLNYLSVGNYINPTETHFTDNKYVEDIKASTNTLQGLLNIELTLLQPLVLDYYLIDYNNKRIFTKNQVSSVKGYNQLVFDTGILPKGDYLLVLTGKELVAKSKFKVL